MECPTDIAKHTTHHPKTLPGRGFVLTAWALRGKKRIHTQSSHQELMGAVSAALQLWGETTRAKISDFEGNPIVSSKTMDRLWAAYRGCYGRATKQNQFIVSGPVINPMQIEHRYSMDLLHAIDFASDWLGNDWEEPYWVIVRGPNGRTILSRAEIERMYHAEVKASGGSITSSIVQAAISFNHGTTLQVLSERRVV